jgi:hypothetical protein
MPTVIDIAHPSELPGDGQNPRMPAELAVKSPVELAVTEEPVALNQTDGISREDF